MAKVFIDESTLTDIGNAIRKKKGTSGLIPTPNMKSEILSISGGGTSIDGGYAVNFYDNNELVETVNAKNGIKVGEPHYTKFGVWEKNGEEIVFPIMYSEDLYFREYAFINSIYEYFGMDRNVYKGFYIDSWYYNSTTWRIKSMFFKDMNDRPYILIGCMYCNSSNGYYDVTITPDEYENTTYYSDAELIFEKLKEGNVSYNYSVASYSPDNSANDYYFTTYDTTNHTNWVDLRKV